METQVYALVRIVYVKVFEHTSLFVHLSFVCVFVFVFEHTSLFVYLSYIDSYYYSGIISIIFLKVYTFKTML